MTRRSLIRALVVLGVLALGWLLRAVTVPLLGAYLLTLVLLPLRDRFKGKIGTSGAAVLSLVLAFLLPLLFLLPTLLEIDELAELIPRLPESSGAPGAVEDGEEQASFEQQLNQQIADLEAFLQDKLPESWFSGLALTDEQVRKLATQLAQYLASFLGAIVVFLGGFLGIMSGLVLVPIFAFFLLDGAPWLPRLRREVPPEWHERFDRIMPRIEEILRLFCTSRLLVAMAKGVIFFVLLTLAGIPGSYTLSLIAGAFSLFPVAGPFIATLGLAVVAFAAQGFMGLVVAGVAYAIAELAEGYVLLPRLVGRGLGLGDFAVLLAVFAGGTLLGVFGMVVAIPGVAVGKVLYDEYLRPVMGTERGEGDEEGGAPAGDGSATA